MKFKLGDKVIILGKEGKKVEPKELCSFVHWKIGDIGYISSIYSNRSIFLSETKGGKGRDGGFWEEDLELFTDNQGFKILQPLSLAELIYKSKMTMIDLIVLLRESPWISNLDIRHGNIIDERLILHAKKCQTLLSFLKRNGYIKIKEIDKWNPKEGKWREVSWKDIDEFKPGVILNRIFRGVDSVFEVTSKVYYRKCGSDRELLSILIFFRKRGTRHMFLSDLFRGDKVMMRISD